MPPESAPESANAADHFVKNRQDWQRMADFLAEAPPPSLPLFLDAFEDVFAEWRLMLPTLQSIIANGGGLTHSTLVQRCKFIIHFLNKNRSGAERAAARYKQRAQQMVDGLIFNAGSAGTGGGGGAAVPEGARIVQHVSGETETLRTAAAEMQFRVLKMETMLSAAHARYWR